MHSIGSALLVILVYLCLSLKGHSSTVDDTIRQCRDVALIGRIFLLHLLHLDQRLSVLSKDARSYTLARFARNGCLRSVPGTWRIFVCRADTSKFFFFSLSFLFSISPLLLRSLTIHFKDGSEKKKRAYCRFCGRQRREGGDLPSTTTIQANSQLSTSSRTENPSSSLNLPALLAIAKPRKSRCLLCKIELFGRKQLSTQINGKTHKRRLETDKTVFVSFAATVSLRGKI